MRSGKSSVLAPPLAAATLERRLGFPAAMALVVGHTIAVGIFLTPGEINRTLASPFWILVIWIVMGAMAVCGALCYGALAARRPEAGGGYVYRREAYGRRVAFLYGWKCFLVMDPGITAALVAGAIGYARFIVPIGDWTGRLLGVGVLALLAALNVLVTPRLYFAMARDGLFPAWAASIHPRFGTPARAISMQAGLAAVLVLVGTFQTIIAYFVFITVVFVGVTAASVLVLRQQADRPAVHVAGYPFTPILFLVLVLALLGLLLVNSPREALTGAAIALLGLPMYRLLNRHPLRPVGESLP